MVSASDDRNRTYANCADGGWGGKTSGPQIDAPSALPASVCLDMLYILTGSNRTRIVGVQNLCRMVRRKLLELLFEIFV